MRHSDPVPGCGGGFAAIGVMEDKEPASTAVGISYVMFFAEDALFTTFFNGAISLVLVLVGFDSCRWWLPSARCVEAAVSMLVCLVRKRSRDPDT